MLSGRCPAGRAGAPETAGSGTATVRARSRRWFKACVPDDEIPGLGGAARESAPARLAARGGLGQLSSSAGVAGSRLGRVRETLAGNPVPVGWRGSAAVVHVGRRRVDRSGCSRATLPGMFNALEVAHELTAGGVDRDQAEVIAGAISRAAEHGDHVTSEQFKAGLAELELRLIKWMVGTVLATAGLTVTILRFLG